MNTMQSAASTPAMTVFTFVGKTAMTPCMPVQRVLRGSYYIKLLFAPGGPIDILYLAKNGAAPTTGVIDLGARIAIATVSDAFWNHIGSPHAALKVCIEYDPATGAIIEVYEC